MINNTMTYNPEGYEHPYGFSLLDELHNFMPELLYDETMFPNEMLAYVRHRMSHLFQPTFVRQQHLYTMYMAQARRAAFNEWRQARNATRPPIVTAPATTAMPDLLTAINAVIRNETPIASNIHIEIPPRTPPAQIRRRVAESSADLGIGNVIGVNTVGQSLRTGNANTVQAPGAEPPPPSRRVRTNENHFMTANQLFHLTAPINTTDETDVLMNILTGAVLGGINTGGRGLWQDVDVVATPAQINAGSTIVEQSAVADDVNCAICQEHTYAAGESSYQWRRIHCSHQFHKECIDSWLEQSVFCPVCRADIRTPSTGGSASYAAAAHRGASTN